MLNRCLSALSVSPGGRIHRLGTQSSLSLYLSLFLSLSLCLSLPLSVQFTFLLKFAVLSSIQLTFLDSLPPSLVSILSLFCFLQFGQSFPFSFVGHLTLRSVFVQLKGQVKWTLGEVPLVFSFVYFLLVLPLCVCLCVWGGPVCVYLHFLPYKEDWRVAVLSLSVGGRMKWLKESNMTLNWTSDVCCDGYCFWSTSLKLNHFLKSANLTAKWILSFKRCAVTERLRWVFPLVSVYSFSDGMNFIVKAFHSWREEEKRTSRHCLHNNNNLYLWDTVHHTVGIITQSQKRKKSL